MTDKDKVIRLLTDLINIRSLSGREYAASQYIEEYLKSIGYDCERGYVSPLSYNVYVKLGSGSPQRLIEVHIDVVEEYDFSRGFNAEVVGDLVYGRGACDTKGGVVSTLLMLEEFPENKLDGTLIVAFVVDEEFCGRGLYDLLFRGYTGEYNLVVEPTNLHICTSASGCIEYRVKIYGASGHGAVSSSGENCIEKAVKILNELVKRKELFRRGSRYMEVENLNIGRIYGGVGGWFVPSYCEVDILHHYLPDRTFQETKNLHESILTKICNSINANFQIEYLHACEGFVSQIDEKIRSWIEYTREFLNRDVLGHMPSESDANLLYNLTKKPTLIFGPGDIRFAHSSKEHVNVNDVILASKIVKEFALI